VKGNAAWRISAPRKRQQPSVLRFINDLVAFESITRPRRFMRGIWIEKLAGLRSSGGTDV
jgi:hypothetical protein